MKGTNRFKYLAVFSILAMLLSLASGISTAVDGDLAANRSQGVVLAGPAAPSLGTAGSFAVLAGSTVTNTGDSNVEGDLGVSPGSAVTGFPPGNVTGTIHAADAVAAQAQADATEAYNDLAGRGGGTDMSGQNLGGRTLTPGVYRYGSSAQLTGALVLDAQGDSHGVFIFQIGSTLTTASSSSVRLINGGNQGNVFWQVGSSATLGTGTAFSGNIIALTSISLTNGATVVGRLLARNGAVTLDNNRISNRTWTADMPTATATAEGPTATATVEAPTMTATVSVTETAIVSPTMTATVSVTETAIVSPTMTATVSVTETAIVSPTMTATGAPTQAPTGAATQAPTGAPTEAPTSAPTEAPTSAPTPAPTGVPPSAPTAVPTNVPGPTPTFAPTVVGFPLTGGAARQGEGQSATLPYAAGPTSALPSILGPLIDPGLDLLADPVDVPLELRIPSLQISAPVLAVGITAGNVMDAPWGSADDPVWQQAFWYRGGGIPGESGTATIAGHVDGLHGRPALFARLKELRRGNLITIHDTRSGLDIRFIVTEMATYTAEQASDLSVLVQIYGSGPMSGKGPQPAPDGLSHLTLITCSGDLVQGAYDRRLVVYSERVRELP
jgi:hypothetical protein